MLQEAVHEEILSPRALSYRRVVIGLSTGMIALWWLPHVDLGQLTVFGVKPAPDTAGSRTIVINGLALVLEYHALFFAYYCWRDSRAWLDDALAPAEGQEGLRRHFPEIRMFFGRGPVDFRNGHTTMTGAACTWRYEAFQSRAKWNPIPPAGQQMFSGGTYDLPLKLVRTFREKFFWFVLIDVGLPVGLVLYSIWAWFHV